MARWIALAIVPLLLAATLLTACSNGYDDEDYEAAAPAATAASIPVPTAARVVAAPTAMPTAAPRPSSAALTDGAADGLDFQQVTCGARSSTGHDAVEVEDVRRATQERSWTIAGLGGLVSASTRRASRSRAPS